MRQPLADLVTLQRRCEAIAEQMLARCKIRIKRDRTLQIFERGDLA